MTIFLILFYFYYSIIILIDILRITKIYEIKVLKNVIRSYEENRPMTATYLIIVSTIIIYIFDRNIAIYSLLIASVSDSAAALYGIKYGKIKVLNNKTLEGTFAFILSGFILIFIFYFIIDGTSLLLLPLLSVILSGIIEHITIGKYDNITTPLSYALFMTAISKI